MVDSRTSSGTTGMRDESGYDHSLDVLFQPIKVRNLTIPNRLAAAPCVHNVAREDGTVSDATREIYKAKARGGWGLITVEASFIRRDGKQFRRMLGAYDDACWAGLNELAEYIQEGGARASIQLMHGGRNAYTPAAGAPPVAPSEKTPALLAPPRELSDREIEELIDHWANMAYLAQRSKFDSVMIHAAHGFLPMQFFSPHTNFRDDRWGEREFFTLELIRRIRKAVGPDFPISIRWSADELIGPAGYTLEDTVRFAPKMVEAGVDLIDISAANFASYDWIIQPIYRERGCLVHMAEAVKKVVDVPVVCVGRINTAGLAARIIRDGRADIVSMTRQSIADPMFPRKVRDRRIQDVRMCIACDACSDYQGNQLVLKCAINYEFGRERELRLVPTDSRKKVLVIGAGVAGLEAARVAHLRGHCVAVWEKQGELGGAVRKVASTIPNLGTGELRNIAAWYSTQVKTLGISVEYNKEATAGAVEAFGPDVVIVATGARPFVPDVPGISQSNVFTIDQYLTARPQIGERVAVVGGQHGAELAVGLRREGKRVILIDESGSVANTKYIYGARRKVLREFLAEEGIEVLINARLKEISAGGMIVCPAQSVQASSVTQSGWVRESADLKTTRVTEEMPIEVDSVILALDRVPCSELTSELRALRAAPEIYEIGDCVEPTNILKAIHRAAYIGREI